MIELNEDPKSGTDSIIEKAKESEQSGATSFMRPEPKQAKKGRGRPPKDKSDAKKEAPKQENKSEEKKGPFIETKVLCYPLVKGISIAGVNYTKDPRAAMSADEAEAMADAMGKIFDKYLPDLMQNYGAEAALCLAMGQYGIRLYAIKKLQQEEAKKKYEAQSRPEASTPPRPERSVKGIPDLASDEHFEVI